MLENDTLGSGFGGSLPGLHRQLLFSLMEGIIHTERAETTRAATQLHIQRCRCMAQGGLGGSTIPTLPPDSHIS